ncbi:hypothetical protein MTsN2n6_33370 [Vibrio fortis]
MVGLLARGCNYAKNHLKDFANNVSLSHTVENAIPNAYLKIIMNIFSSLSVSAQKEITNEIE